MHALYGGTLRKVRPARLGWKPQEHWVLQRASTVICFLQDTLPYLREKRVQAQVLIDHFSSRMNRAKAEMLRSVLHNEKQREIEPAQFARSDLKRTCQLCPRTSRARGLCVYHYQRARLRAGVDFMPQSAKPFAYARAPTPEERAYAAGYFDGDGSFDFRAVNGSWYIFITFNQTRPEGVELLHEIYGGTIRVCRPATPRRMQLNYRIQRRAAALQFLADIRPYSIERRAEINLLVNNYYAGMPDAEALALRAMLKAAQSSS